MWQQFKFREVIYLEKQLLLDYIDACEIIKDTETAIRRLKQKKKEIIQDSVKGSNQEFPYQEQHFVINGNTFCIADYNRMCKEEELLKEQQIRAATLKKQVEQWMLTLPMRMQRIIQLRIFKDYTWEKTALKMGRKCTADSVRMEFQRFIEKL